MIKKVRIKGYRKFKDFEFIPKPGMNVIVGPNDAGKSTLIEAITFALTGRLNGIYVKDALDPYMFNRQNVVDFFRVAGAERSIETLPTFQIDLHLDFPEGELQILRGINNLDREDAPGLSITAEPDPDYYQELYEYFNSDGLPEILPVEYYRIEWRDFAGNIVFRKPKGLGVSLIDSRTIRSEKTLKYYTKQLLEDNIDAKKRSIIAAEYRRMRTTLTSEVLSLLNQPLIEETETSDAAIGFQIDQSRSAAWENSVIPGIDQIPLSLSGQGNQARVKTLLSLKRSSENKNVVFIEEPENHLSYTRLRELIHLVEQYSQGKQVFITSHSSFVLNRLGLDGMTIINNENAKTLETLSEDTVKYFKKVSGFDTMRLVLADKIVVVEGPSDEIIFTKLFKQIHGVNPLDWGIDVMSVNGLSFKRCFELANLLDRSLYALRDNDDKDIDELKTQFSSYQKDGVREIFIGEAGKGKTLETQLLSVNSEAMLRTILGLSTHVESVANWMLANKTDAALRLLESDQVLNAPSYMEKLIETLGRENR